MDYAIKKIDNTPPNEYNPVGMFNFHMVRIATSMTDLRKTQTLMCRDFVVNNSTVTLYSIHKPKEFQAYHMGIMNDVPFNGQILAFDTSSRGYKYRIVSPSYIMENDRVGGYELLDSKTINVNRLDDAESHTIDPDAKRDHVWWKVNEEKAKEILGKRKLRHIAMITTQNEKFVSESSINNIYNELLTLEQIEIDGLIIKQNNYNEYNATKTNKEIDKEYASLSWFKKLFTPKPEHVVAEVVESRELTELSKKTCLEVSKYISKFNERHGNLLDLTHVFNKFGKPE